MPATTPLVFISYRRDDSNWATDLLFERLEAVFGEGSLFRDVDSVEPGQDFRDRINESLERSVVVLVVIGPQWLHVQDANGKRRLEQPEDWVRIEIELALKRQLKVIPILLYPAKLPSATELPASLAKLIYLQAVTIYPGEDFNLGFHRLMDGIITSLPEDRRADALRRIALTLGPAPARPTSRMSSWRRILMLVAAVLAVCVALSFRFMGTPSNDFSLLKERDAATYRLAGEVSNWFRVRFRKLEGAAKRPALRSNDGSLHKPDLMVLARASDFPGGVYTLNERGIILAQATPNYPMMDDLRGLNFSHREYFVQCQKRNRSITTNSFMSANRNELIVVLATPRTGGDGSFLGILDGVVDVGTSPLSAIAQRITTNRHVDLYLIDTNGVVLASNETSEVAKAFSNLGLLDRFRNHSFDARDEREAKVVPVSETPYLVVGKVDLGSR